MILTDKKKIERRLAGLSQTVIQSPRKVRIKEYFPEENAVTVQLINATEDFGGAVPLDSKGDFKFPLGYRGDISEGLAPQPGDIGLLFYTGMQFQRGFILLSHTPGGKQSSTYVPIRGNWSL